MIYHRSFIIFNCLYLLHEHLVILFLVGYFFCGGLLVGGSGDSGETETTLVVAFYQLNQLTPAFHQLE